MSSATKENIKNLLIEWREAKAAEWGYTEEHEEFCARNSHILHDIFVESISSNAKNIHSVRDLHSCAFYWKWIDVYGQELFAVLNEHLYRAKRICREEDCYYADDALRGPKRVRTQVYM